MISTAPSSSWKSIAWKKAKTPKAGGTSLGGPRRGANRRLDRRNRPRRQADPASYGHAAAIEVEAQILESPRFLEDELKNNAAAPVASRSRIQKRWNQIGLVGGETPDFDATLKNPRG